MAKKEVKTKTKAPPEPRAKAKEKPAETPKLSDLQTNFLRALEANNGNISKAAKACKLHRNTVYRWIKNVPDFKEAYNEQRASEFDWAESRMKLLANGIPILSPDGSIEGWVEKPDINALRYFLSKNQKFGEPPTDETENQNKLIIQHTFISVSRKEDKINEDEINLTM